MAAATDAVTTKMEEKTTSGMEAKFSAFPFKPYGIQLDFMKALYSSLDKGGVAMLESPTGTGKTLSIICSALQWIVDRKQLLKSEAGGVSGRNGTTGDQPLSDDEPDWMRSFVPVSERKDQKREKAKKLGHRSWGFDKRRPKKDCRDLFSGSGKEEEDVGNQKGPVMPQKTRDTVELNEDEFLLEEYESEDEGKDDGNPKRKANSVSFSSSSDGEDEDGLRDEEEEEDLKVYFCSRTHSQLSQFIKELRRTTFASELKVISLGSRKNLCINEEVHKLGNSTRISERCLDLQKHRKEEFSKTKIEGNGRRIQRKKSSSGCPMLRKHKLQRQFMNEVTQLEALDIEDLVHLGKRIGTCPYYGSRSVVPVVSLVVLPYQSLLFKSSRESLGLNLKNSIVIIDEAHNLADCLTSMFDSKITLSQLEQVHSHLELYFERFRKLLGAGNRRYIQTLMVITRAFLRVFLDDKNSSILSSCQGIEHDPGEKNVCDSSMAINEFLFSLNVDNINLVKLMLYIKESKIIHKVNGYGAKLASIQGGSMIDDGGGKENALSGFQALVDVLSSLTNNDGDGRIIISRRRDICSSKQEGYIKYVMLAGEKIFSEITNQAHAVVLAGGTLQPMEETRARLFPWIPPDQLHFFSCCHIVPPESILPIAVSHGPSGLSYDFSYSSRSSRVMIEELGRLLCNLVTVVPEGIVVFFSSFEYEGLAHDTWKASGILARIMKKKRIFREPRSNADVELVLKEYKETILALSAGGPKENPVIYNGAMLLAVVGGKVSEGINFSDGMGRCVVMVGLPYANPSDVELMERIKHIEGLGESNNSRTPVISTNNESCNGEAVQAGFGILRSCKRQGREYYENLCMKAVNQSIELFGT
ncbi:ATP-dependent DNA helicase DDX11 isoform X2 [Macadamia integrifolia]|uniref:ATP-dependent DNA helicase DDX11 isoform X2 n=1 Tax=Macadamia integrifolia TaxID=60698 RepID=UPI001C52F6B9|nr:ATP-dependent DNA helicase DDX11 isoform X2 [Macadamia integrifolia]